MFNPHFTITLSIANALLVIERKRTLIGMATITPSMIASLKETARMMTTHYSTQIEGNRLTMKEVEAITQGKKIGFPGRERDKEEVENYMKALAYVEEKASLSTPLDTKYIQMVHGIAFEGGVQATPYRDGQNIISDSRTGAIVYMPPEASDVSGLMDDLIERTNRHIAEEALPAPLIAALFHYQFATIHPYFDGNGRTARLLTTHILHVMGYGMQGIYSLEEYYAKNLEGYYGALAVGDSHNYYMGRADADITSFVEYFCVGMSLSYENVCATVTHASHDDILSEKQKLLSLCQELDEITSKDVARYFGINQSRARYLLQKYLKKGVLRMENTSKKARTYGLVDM